MVCQKGIFRPRTSHVGMPCPRAQAGEPRVQEQFLFYFLFFLFFRGLSSC